MTTRTSINSIMGISIALIGLTLASYSSAQAAATAPGQAPSPSPSPSPSADSGYSESAEGQNQPQYQFVSPDGHTVFAYDAIRSAKHCAVQFVERQANSNEQQYRFWTRCILGYSIR